MVSPHTLLGWADASMGRYRTGVRNLVVSLHRRLGWADASMGRYNRLTRLWNDTGLGCAILWYRPIDGWCGLTCLWGDTRLGRASPQAASTEAPKRRQPTSQLHEASMSGPRAQSRLAISEDIDVLGHRRLVKLARAPAPRSVDVPGCMFLLSLGKF